MYVNMLMCVYIYEKMLQLFYFPIGEYICVGDASF